MPEIVTLKGTGDGVVMKIGSAAIFSDVIDAITEKIRANRNFFRGTYKVYIESVTPLPKSDIIRLRSVIDTFLPDCEVIYKEPGTVSNYTSEQKKQEGRSVAIKGATETATVYEKDIEDGEHLRVVGNLVIIGNVKKNATVTAGGNIIVLGDIYGTVRAGYRDNKNAYIAYRNLSGGEISVSSYAYNEDMYPVQASEDLTGCVVKKAQLIKNSIFISKFL